MTSVHQSQHVERTAIQHRQRIDQFDWSHTCQHGPGVQKPRPIPTQRDRQALFPTSIAVEFVAGVIPAPQDIGRYEFDAPQSIDCYFLRSPVVYKLCKLHDWLQTAATGLFALVLDRRKCRFLRAPNGRYQRSLRQFGILHKVGILSYPQTLRRLFAPQSIRLRALNFYKRAWSPAADSPAYDRPLSQFGTSLIGCALSAQFLPGLVKLRRSSTGRRSLFLPKSQCPSIAIEQSHGVGGAA